MGGTGVTANNPRLTLLNFLGQEVFLPAINADPANYAAAADRPLLEGVKRRVTTTRLKYQSEYQTAADVKANFFLDLDSPFGQTLAGDMFLLKLTRFEDVQKAFSNLCRSLGV